jgi:hypothetical protein
VVGAGLSPAHWSARASSRWPRAVRERSSEVGERSGLQVGSWHSPGRRLDAGWGFRVVEVSGREGSEIFARFASGSPFLCVQVDRASKIRERERE